MHSQMTQNVLEESYKNCTNDKSATAVASPIPIAYAVSGGSFAGYF